MTFLQNAQIFCTDLLISYASIDFLHIIGYTYLAIYRRCGEIGRHEGLKILW